jgi:RNA polymerase sigma-70 factor (ECF subfamily)
VVDAFIAAARGGDLDALAAVLDPGVVLRAKGGPAFPAATRVVRGATAVAHTSLGGARGRLAAVLRPALVDGPAGLIMTEGCQPFAVWGFTVAGGKIVEINAVTDAERLRCTHEWSARERSAVSAIADNPEHGPFVGREFQRLPVAAAE